MKRNHLKGSQIKSIQVLISKATLEIDNIKAQQKVLQSSMDKQLSQLKKYQEELLALQMDSMEIIVSEHAVLRYLERVYKLDITKLYKEIIPPKVEKQIKEYDKALEVVDRLMELNPALGSQDSDNLEVLVLLIQKYEEKHWDISELIPSS